MANLQKSPLPQGQENLLNRSALLQSYYKLLKLNMEAGIKSMVASSDNFRLSANSNYLNERKAENVIEPPQRFECKVCQKSYKNKRHLYRHEKEECVGVEPKFKCEICLSMFRRKYHLSRHLFNRHGVDVKLLKSELNIASSVTI
ncbi:zinc finger protein 354A-like [Euwallacea fornicatus]|uniref:zinc finger protein 354A-like n=1 Tax=Euwallacea fornicatus TaxID=995702 RepID=UPI00338E8E05